MELLPKSSHQLHVRIHLDFDAEMVDEILKHLTVLRAQMLPAPTRN